MEFAINLFIPLLVYLGILGICSFHVEYQGFKAKIEINTGILEGKMPKTAINLTLQWLSEHRQELLDNWERIEKMEPLNKIDPLT